MQTSRSIHQETLSHFTEHHVSLEGSKSLPLVPVLSHMISYAHNHYFIICRNRVIQFMSKSLWLGRSVAQAVSGRLLTPSVRVQARFNLCGIVVDKGELGQVFSECFGSYCQAFHLFLNNHHPLYGTYSTGHLVAAEIVDTLLFQPKK
jgi:hypothetical protein